MLKIPGVNSKNVNSLMNKVANLFDLFALSEDEINKIIENSKNAKLIYEFVNKSIRYDAGDVLRNEFGFEDLNDFFMDGDEKRKDRDVAAAKDLLKVNATNKKPRGKRTKK